MKIDAEMVQRWLDAYTHAWMTYDPDEIAALFTDDAQYRWHPWDEGEDVARGRSHIVAAWRENRDPTGTYRGAYRPLLVKDSMAIAVGVSSYYTDQTQRELKRGYHNLWVLHFTDEGSVARSPSGTCKHQTSRNLTAVGMTGTLPQGRQTRSTKLPDLCGIMKS